MEGYTALPIAFGDGSGEEFHDRELVQGQIAKVIGLDDGTVGGNPTVGFFIELPDGRVAFAETTWRLLNALHAACKGRWGPVL